LIKNLRNGPPDSREGDATREERLNGYFVGGVEHSGAGAAQRSGFYGEIQRGEILPPRIFEFQPS
jgi:hypothetical protein